MEFLEVTTGNAVFIDPMMIVAVEEYMTRKPTYDKPTAEVPAAELHLLGGKTILVMDRERTARAIIEKRYQPVDVCIDPGIWRDAKRP